MWLNFFSLLWKILCWVWMARSSVFVYWIIQCYDRSCARSDVIVYIERKSNKHIECDSVCYWEVVFSVVCFNIGQTTKKFVHFFFSKAVLRSRIYRKKVIKITKTIHVQYWHEFVRKLHEEFSKGLISPKKDDKVKPDGLSNNTSGLNKTVIRFRSNRHLLQIVALHRMALNLMWKEKNTLTESFQCPAKDLYEVLKKPEMVSVSPAKWTNTWRWIGSVRWKQTGKIEELDPNGWWLCVDIMLICLH